MDDAFDDLRWSDIERMSRLVDLQFFRVLKCPIVDLDARYGQLARPRPGGLA
jgi:hypothetical protein